MLMLGTPKQTVEWPAAGVTLVLIPLLEDVNFKLIEETITHKRNDAGVILESRRDVPKYGQLVGQHCIKGWTGVCGEDGKPSDCTPEAIDNFMLIEEASDFVVKKVKSLSIHLTKDKDKAKKGSPPS